MGKKEEIILLFDELDSTNTYVKNSDDIENGMAVMAKVQTAGHGRMGRRFYSEEGGIYLSLCRKTTLTAKELVPLTGMCAVAVSDAIEKVCGVRPDIRWMNDLLICGKKVCGILVENVFGGSDIPEKVVIGVGINASQSADSFDGELAGIASSIELLTGKKPDTRALTFAVIGGLNTAFDTLDRKKSISRYVQKYRENCITLGEKITVLKSSDGVDPQAPPAEGVKLPVAYATDINDDFSLNVRFDNGKEEALFSGEVSIKM